MYRRVPVRGMPRRIVGPLARVGLRRIAARPDRAAAQSCAGERFSSWALAVPQPYCLLRAPPRDRCWPLPPPAAACPSWRSFSTWCPEVVAAERPLLAHSDRVPAGRPCTGISEHPVQDPARLPEIPVADGLDLFLGG